jgi:hypothetical protein
MLRLIALLLLLINGVYWLWSDGRLPGFAPDQQTEPQRLKQQIKPQSLRLLTAQELQQLEATPAAAKTAACLQAGPFSEAQSAQLRPLLSSALPGDSWTLQTVVTPAQWIVYMGKYANADDLTKKQAELTTLKIHFEPVLEPTLQYGLSLGSYTTRAAASAGLDTLGRRGIRTARVLQQRPEARGAVLRIGNADDALRARLNELDPALGDRVWSACP